MKKNLILILAIVFSSHVYGNSDDYYCHTINDTLYIGNKHIERSFRWNGGNLITLNITDKSTDHIWISESGNPDLDITDTYLNASNGKLSSNVIHSNGIYSEHLQVEVLFSLGQLDVKRIFIIYKDSPAIACDTYFKGVCHENWTSVDTDLSKQKNIESVAELNKRQKTPVLDKVALKGKHWKLTTIMFTDVTDRTNTFINEGEYLSYRENFLKGNILFAHNPIEERGLFFLKESPISDVQIAFPGSDFITGFGHIKTVGLGLYSSDIDKDEWTKAYGIVTGVYSGGEQERLIALRKYQKQIRITKPVRDDIIILNTWGDRSIDTRINEEFCIKEIEAGVKLGITQFQLDDGWQGGRSAASAYGGSFKDIWKNSDYWKPDKERFPNGLDPVVAEGIKNNIEISLWFNPSDDNDYANWEKDADLLIGMYKKYNIRTFKIDGITIANKLSEKRLRAMYNKVMEHSDWNIVLNFDVTASKRVGYVYFNEYGTVFLENRYTDWQNYYPYWTLRNLWMLSKYMPTDKLQIEFLNKWRNTRLYGSDPFAPDVYSFDYLFAITMVGQPLAWLEASNLPEEAFDTRKLIDAYKKIQFDLYDGIILPIGEEPSGKSWTGFQSIHDGRGYFIIFREANDLSKKSIKVWLEKNHKLKITPIWGSSYHTSSVVTSGNSSEIEFKIDNPNDFVILEYAIIK